MEHGNGYATLVERSAVWASDLPLGPRGAHAHGSKRRLCCHKLNPLQCSSRRCRPQITMRKVDGWQRRAEKPFYQIIDIAA